MHVRTQVSRLLHELCHFISGTVDVLKNCKFCSCLYCFVTFSILTLCTLIHIKTKTETKFHTNIKITAQETQVYLKEVWTGT